MPVIPVKRGDIKSSIIPAGTYHFRVAKAGYFSVEKYKRENPGKNIKVQDDTVELDAVIIDEGEFFGRHVFDSLPITGPFANRLSRFLAAVDYPEDDDLDTDKLVDREFYSVLRIQKAQGEYDERNRFGKFIPVEEFDSATMGQGEEDI